MSAGPVIFAVSDSTGETAEQAVRAAVAQFRPPGDLRTLVFGRVRDEAAARAVVGRARREDALVVYTLVDPQQRARMREIAQENGVTAVDLLSGLILELSRHLGRTPLAVPGLGHQTDDAYFRRIEAVEFAVHNDDGRLPRNLGKAEVVLVGVSRTSKTPLSNYIAHRGLRVANVPIVKDLPIPRELEEVDPRRVFALVIDPVTLANVRRRRMEALGMPPTDAYADLHAIREEMLWARRLFRDHPGWTVVDTTDRAVEETAAAILETMRDLLAEAPAAPGGD
jgi:regulator of PEP synthase PpsR (kinase-PPPase family)